MRVLFTCVPGVGHFHPMVPLARQVASTGHEVAFATASPFCRPVSDAGFTSFPAGLGHGPTSEQAARLPQVADLGPGQDWVFGAHLFAGVAAAAKVADLVRVIRAWRPDLVVHGAMDFAAPVAASATGVPYVGHAFGPLSSVEFLELAGDVVAPLWRQWGLEPEKQGGLFTYLYLDICPPSFQAAHADAVAVAHPLRPAPFEGGSDAGLPTWAASLPPAPTVYVTLGTVANHAPGVFEAVLEGLSHEALNLVVTTGNNRDPAELGPQPDNVHIERFLPHRAILPLCDLVIAHGGSGTTIGALSHGLPVLVLPQGVPNQVWMADRAVSLGLGIKLSTNEVVPEAVRGAVHDLLGVATYRRRAQDVRREIAQMPGPEQVVPLLERVARERRAIIRAI